MFAATDRKAEAVPVTSAAAGPVHPCQSEGSLCVWAVCKAAAIDAE